MALKHIWSIFRPKALPAEVAAEAVASYTLDATVENPPELMGSPARRDQ